MARTFAAKKYKSQVLRELDAPMSQVGYARYTHNSDTLVTEYRRRLNADVVIAIQVWFFDGPIAAKDRVWISGVFAIGSRSLLSWYYKLHGEPEGETYLPIGGSLNRFAPTQGLKGGWEFIGNETGPTLLRFHKAIAEDLEQLAMNYDTPEKQIARLLCAESRELHWNDFFFTPIAHLYLGEKERAVEAAKHTLETANSPQFAEAYKHFYQRVRDAAA